MTMRRLQALLLVLIAALLFSNVTSAQAQGNAVTTVEGWERMQNMVEVYEAFGTHGSFAGPYDSPNTPIDGMTEETATRLISLRAVVQQSAFYFKHHVGFKLSKGDWTLLVGAYGPINRRVPFQVTDPNGTWIEISGIFYDPRSDDFAIRLQSSYIGRGQHPRSGNDSVKPLAGGALYIEASWEQISSMARYGEFKVTSAVFEGYGPNKHINMDLGGQLFTQHVQNVTSFNAWDALEIREPNPNPGYVPWDALVNGRVQRNTIGAGVCGMFAPIMNSVFRLMLANPDVIYDYEGIGHDDGHEYNPTGNDPNLWAQTKNGRYFVVDSTTMDPGPNFTFSSSRPFSVNVTTLIHNRGTWDEFFAITEAHFN